MRTQIPCGMAARLRRSRTRGTSQKSLDFLSRKLGRWRPRLLEVPAQGKPAMRSIRVRPKRKAWATKARAHPSSRSRTSWYRSSERPRLAAEELAKGQHSAAVESGISTPCCSAASRPVRSPAKSSTRPILATGAMPVAVGCGSDVLSGALGGRSQPRGRPRGTGAVQSSESLSASCCPRSRGERERTAAGGDSACGGCSGTGSPSVRGGGSALESGQSGH